MRMFHTSHTAQRIQSWIASETLCLCTFAALSHWPVAADDHMRGLCGTNKHPGELFSKMKQVQQFYYEEKATLDDSRALFVAEMQRTIEGQFKIRPSSQEEMDLKVQAVHEKMDVCLSRLQWFCNRLLVQLQIHNSRNRKRRNLDPEAVHLLRSWFDNHTEHPYPSEAEKDDLSQRTGLSLSQISTWFVNARARYPWRQQAQVVSKKKDHAWMALSTAP